MVLFRDDVTEIVSNQCECGGKIATTKKIAGGTIVDKLNYPWFTYIIAYKDQNKYSCGGSLISDFYVLTAASCVYVSIYFINILIIQLKWRGVI